MLEFRNVSFSYEQKNVFDRFNFELADDEIVALMGPSGCGKTTLLQLAARLQKPSAGVILSSFVRVSYVFQEPRLFPWLTVLDNLLAVVKDEKDTKEEALSLLEQLSLSECAKLYPNELSGGMKSRVALARALLYKGDLLLLDEPFAALDEALRLKLSVFLRNHLKSTKTSAILVTHHLQDAQSIADRFFILDPAKREKT